MVLDLKKIHLKTSIEDDALWIVEQIPRLVQHVRDGLDKDTHLYMSVESYSLFVSMCNCFNECGY